MEGITCFGCRDEDMWLWWLCFMSMAVSKHGNFCAVRGGKFEKVEHHRVVWICRQETLWRSSMMHIRGWRSLLSALFFLWNVKGSSKVQNLLGNDVSNIQETGAFLWGLSTSQNPRFLGILACKPKTLAPGFVESFSSSNFPLFPSLGWRVNTKWLGEWVPRKVQGLLESTWPICDGSKLEIPSFSELEKQRLHVEISTWSLQVLAWLYLSTRERARSVAEASRLCGGANAPSNLTFINTFMLYCMQKSYTLCLSEIAIGPRMPSFQWGTLPRSGRECLFFLFATTAAWSLHSKRMSNSKHGGTTAACYKLQHGALVSFCMTFRWRDAKWPWIR